MKKIELFLKKIYWNRFSWEFSSSQKWEWYDLEDFKEYEKQDNVKKINRKMSAKYDKEYVSVYRIDKEPVLDVFIDISYNLEFFEKQVNEYLSFLNLIIKKLGIKKNIYIYENWKNIKINDFNYSKKQKKSQINEIFASLEFKNQKNYKILVSDFLFLEEKNIDFLLNFQNKVFLAIVPILQILQNAKLPLYNGFFNAKLNNDILQEYGHKLDTAKKYSSDFEEI